MNTRTSKHFPTDRLKRVALLMLVLTMFSGCAQRYKVTLRNHQELVTSNRPRFDKETQTYRFKDSSGKMVVLPGFRVKDIQPY